MHGQTLVIGARATFCLAPNVEACRFLKCNVLETIPCTALPYGAAVSCLSCAAQSSSSPLLPVGFKLSSCCRCGRVGQRLSSRVGVCVVVRSYVRQATTLACAAANMLAFATGTICSHCALQMRAKELGLCSSFACAVSVCPVAVLPATASVYSKQRTARFIQAVSVQQARAQLPRQAERRAQEALCQLLFVEKRRTARARH